MLYINTELSRCLGRKPYFIPVESGKTSAEKYTMWRLQGMAHSWLTTVRLDAGREFITETKEHQNPVRRPHNHTGKITVSSCTTCQWLDVNKGTDKQLQFTHAMDFWSIMKRSDHYFLQ